MVVITKNKKWTEIIELMASDGWFWRLSNHPSGYSSNPAQGSFCSFFKYIDGRYIGGFASGDAGDETTSVYGAAIQALKEEEKVLA